MIAYFHGSELCIHGSEVYTYIYTSEVQKTNVKYPTFINLPRRNSHGVKEASLAAKLKDWQVTGTSVNTY